MNTTDAVGGVRGALGMNLLVMSTWALGLLWSVLVPMRYFFPAVAPNDIAPVALFFMAVACGLVAWLGGVFTQSLGAGARVLGQRQVPTRLWRQWLRAGTKKTLVHSGMLALAVATLSLPEPAPWHGLTAAAIVSLLMSLSVARGLAFQGLAPRVWAWAAPILVLLLLVGFSMAGGFASALRWIDSWPWIVLFGAAASWPVLALVTYRRWLKCMPVLRTGAVGVPQGLWPRCRKLALRYTPLTGWELSPQLARNAARRNVFQVMYVPAGLFLFFSNLLAHPVIGQSVLVRLGMLGIFVIVVSTGLVCKDLHWRMLLAPGGMRRGRLGWHIALSSATSYFLGLLFFGVAVFGAVSLVRGSVVLHLILDGSWVSFTHGIAFLMELVFAVSVATMIRGTTYHKRWIAGLTVVWALVVLALLLVLLPRGPFHGDSFLAFALEPFKLDLRYMLTLVLLSAMALLCANRLWTIDKLLQSARK